MNPTTPQQAGRRAENIGFYVAITIAALLGLVEIADRAGILPNAETGSFPWGVVLLQVMLVLPKTLGRATAGKVWDALAGALERKAAK